MMKRALRFCIFVLAGVLPAQPDAQAQIQDWPTKPVRIVVPFGAGSTPDIIVRVIADHLQTKSGQTFIVENKPGASGNTGTDAVAKSAPDGTTIGISIGGPLAINPLLFAKMPYDAATDIAPITQLVSMPSALTINADLKVNTVAELVALLRREPGKYNYGSIGVGSLSQLAMEAIALKSGTTIVHVPYPSSPAAMTAVIRGDVQMACMPAISVTPHVAAGKVKILAVSTAKRSPYMPDVPSLKEADIDVEADAWNGMIAPGRTPDAMVASMQREIAAALFVPTVREKLAAQYMEPVGSTPAAFRAHIAGEVARWAPVIKAANIRVN